MQATVTVLASMVTICACVIGSQAGITFDRGNNAVAPTLSDLRTADADGKWGVTNKGDDPTMKQRKTLAKGRTDLPTQMELLSPNGGERWSVDSKHYIIWATAPGSTSNTVRIEYTIDGGQGWNTIDPSARSNGRFLWKTPDSLSDKCKIRISDKIGGVADESDANFSVIPSQEVTGYKWSCVTENAAYAPRDGAGALVFKGKMWLLGGWNPKDKANFPRTCNNEVWSSRDGADWHLEKPNTFIDKSFDPSLDWEGTHTAGYVVHDGKMWIVGGDPIQGHYQYDVWNSTDGKKWNLVNNKVPWGPRALHYTVAFDRKIWVIGGQTTPQFAPAEEIFYNDVWNTSDGVQWTKLEPKEPLWPPRGMIGGSVVFQNRMWILGGGTYDTPKVPERKLYNDVWSSADGVNWEQHVRFAPWRPRQYHSVAVFDGKMWVMEGAGNDVWYSSDGVNWYELPDTPWKSRHAASAFVHNNALWMLAGIYIKDVWKLTRSKN